GGGLRRALLHVHGGRRSLRAAGRRRLPPALRAGGRRRAPLGRFDGQEPGAHAAPCVPQSRRVLRQALSGLGRRRRGRAGLARARREDGRPRPRGLAHGIRGARRARGGERRVPRRPRRGAARARAGGDRARGGRRAAGRGLRGHGDPDRRRRRLHRLRALLRLRDPRGARRRRLRPVGARAAQRGARAPLRRRAAEVPAALLRRDAPVDVAAVPRGRPRVARAGAGVAGRDGGLAAGVAAVGPGAHVDWVRHALAMPASLHAWSLNVAPHAALHRLLDGGLGARAVEPVALATSLAILAAVAYAARGRPAPGTPAFDWAFGLAVAAVPLVAPFSEEHHLVVLLLPLALLVLAPDASPRAS